MMKKIKTYLLSFFLVLIVTETGALVQAEAELKNDLESEASLLNGYAKQSHGEEVIAQLLEREFNVSKAEMTNLRSRALGYGEMAIIYSLTQQMPGGIAEMNIQKLVSMWNGPPKQGWGPISRALGLNLGIVKNQISGIEREIHEDLRRAQDREYDRIETRTIIERSVGGITTHN